MSKLDIRLGNIYFDEQKEKDIIERINNLTTKRKLADFIEQLLRIALKDDDLWRQFIEKKGCLGEMTRLGTLPCTDKFFLEKTREVEQMKRKVDQVYKMCIEMHTAVKFGKAIGIEERANSLLRAQFLLQSQIEELTTVLGVSNVGYVFASNRVEEVDTYCNESLKYIIETYSGIVEELKVSMATGGVFTGGITGAEQHGAEQHGAEQHEAGNANGTGNGDGHGQIKSEETHIVSEPSVVKSNDTPAKTERKLFDDLDPNGKPEDEIVDFGLTAFEKNADLGALSKFFGD